MMFGPLFGTVTRLFATAMGEKDLSEATAARAFSLLGQFIVFRVARTAALRALGWEEIGDREMETVEAVIDANLFAILKDARP